MTQAHASLDYRSNEIARDALVAVVNTDDDLKRFLHEGWYRIPERALGRSVSPRIFDEVKTLALYHTQSITSAIPGAIEYYGTIDSVETHRRSQLLPNEPDHPAADQPYHKVSVASVKSFALPIFNKRPRRITFIRTSADLLATAREIGDLYLGSQAEEGLVARLHNHDIKVDRRVFMQVKEQLVEVDFGLYRDDRAIGVLCGGCSDAAMVPQFCPGEAPEAWNIIRFTPLQIESNLHQCIDQIMSAFGDAGRA